MERRFVSIWFRYLSTDWFSLREPRLKCVPFVLRAPSHGRMVITAVNAMAEEKGIHIGMVLADARAIEPELEVRDDKPDLIEKLLKRLAEWCIRFTPVAAPDPPDGLLLDASGCTHLWKGDERYIKTISRKLSVRGYHVRVAIADTPGVAWGVVRYANGSMVVPPKQNAEALSNLPPEALRLEPETTALLYKLGLNRISQFIHMPASSLRRRFGQHVLDQIEKALGKEEEIIQPVQPQEPYLERLPCLEPVTRYTGIQMALQQLLEKLCQRLRNDQKGLRSAMFKSYRVDGMTMQVDIGTNRPSHHVIHLSRLFENMLPTIDPGLGIELFTIEAPAVEDYYPHQEKLWEGSVNLDDDRLAELIDRLGIRVGMDSIHRFIPLEHHWPERSFKRADTLAEEPVTVWRTDKVRPVRILHEPEWIEVTAPIPDYPPMLFRHKGKLHKIVRADGPERIEQEWWLQQGQHRDYYRVEDEEGKRYWLFRLGHYDDHTYKWFLHGYFA